jgi:hypothetical protein
MGVALADHGCRSEFGADAGFVDLCVVQIMERKSFTVKELSEMFGVSDDWVLKTFNNVRGKFRQGKSILYPYESVKAKVRSLLNL